MNKVQLSIDTSNIKCILAILRYATPDELGEAVLEQLEDIIVTDKYAAFEYASTCSKRVIKAEPAIAKSPTLSLSYAANVIKGRFEAGEAAIATDSYSSLKYAILLGTRFELGEPAISMVQCYWEEYRAQFFTGL